jgi:hypothetical protein
MKHRLFWRSMIGGLLALLVACGTSSRFDDKPVVDVCKIIDDADAQRILGPLTEPPKPDPGHGLAGACVWHFASPSGDRHGTLTVSMVTRASNAGSQNLGGWFEMNKTALTAMIDPHPKEVKDLSDRTFLFELSKTDASAILMRQSQTFAILRINGASSSQLESFARILAREAGARETARETNAKPIAEQSDRANDGLHGTEPQHGAIEGVAANRHDKEKEEMRVVYTMGYVEECIRADQLLRKSCERWLPQLSAKLKPYCDLPAETFEARTANAYRSFKDIFRDQTRASEPKLSTILEQARADFDKRFAIALSGSVSGFDFETLSRMLGRECSVVETEWLHQTEQPASVQ